jgi:hypothetical protein
MLQFPSHGLRQSAVDFDIITFLAIRQLNEMASLGAQG